MAGFIQALHFEKFVVSIGKLVAKTMHGYFTFFSIYISRILVTKLLMFPAHNANLTLASHCPS